MPCPGHVAVIGGGRWARVLLDVLGGLVPAPVTLSAHSRGHADAMKDWAGTRRLGKRIEVSADLPHALDPASSAVIVANAACDHEMAVEFALAARVPVMVEKPIGLSAAAAQRLASLARARNLRFAAAHVFLFARYLENFAAAVASAGPLQSLHLEWADPKDELRHGERKRYDPELAMHADLLPHAVSIFGAVAGRLPERCEKVKVGRGGAKVEMKLVAGNMACSVQMERESAARRRLLHVAAGGQDLILDFSIEPGTIRSGGTRVNGDPRWDSPDARRPVAYMLAAFLAWAAGGEKDPRLALEPGLRACELADAAAKILQAR